MAKLVWRVKLVAELGLDLLSETEVGRIERDDRVISETPGLTLDESKRLRAAAQVEIDRAPCVPSFMSRVRSPDASAWGGLQRLLG